MMLRNSIIKDNERLKAFPSLQRKGLIIFEFKAENKGRKRMCQYFCMLEEEAKSIKAVSFKAPFAAATDWSSSSSRKKATPSPKPAIAHDLGLHPSSTQIADALVDVYGYRLMGSCLGAIWE